jgi:hypothetical protein
LRCLRRNPEFIDQLHLITLKEVEDIVGRYPDQLDILGWGWDVWDYRMRTLDFSGWADLGKVKKMVRYLHKCGLTKSIIWLSKKFGWVTPIILLARKKGELS